MIFQIREVKPGGSLHLFPTLKPLAAALAFVQSLPNGRYQLLDMTGRVVQEIESRSDSVSLDGTVWARSAN